MGAGRLSCAAAAAGLFLGTAVWAAAPAAAHVTVSSPDAAAGSYGKVVVRVPDESASASTVTVQLTLPQDVVFPSVSVKPHPGWTARTAQRVLPTPVSEDGFTLSKAVSSITWTAAPGQGIAPGQFDEFEVSLGPFPKSTRTLTFAASQTYSDVRTVRWDQPRVGGAEPEHPAPTLRVAQPAVESSASGTGSAAVRSPGAAPVASTDSTNSTDNRGWVAVGLSGVSVLLAGAALGVAVRRGRVVTA
ncbi:MAG: YcnI family protein [Motilibacteraceae bacterium]